MHKLLCQAGLNGWLVYDQHVPLFIPREARVIRPSRSLREQTPFSALVSPPPLKQKPKKASTLREASPRGAMVYNFVARAASRPTNSVGTYIFLCIEKDYCLQTWFLLFKFVTSETMESLVSRTNALLVGAHI